MSSSYLAIDRNDLTHYQNKALDIYKTGNMLFFFLSGEIDDLGFDEIGLVTDLYQFSNT